MSFTPGPWTATESNAIYANGEPIAGCAGESGQKNPTANALLMAAAPDLLGACVLAEHAFRVPANERIPEQLAALSILRAVIAKAEGRS